MGMDEILTNTQTSISKHAYFDLSRISPLVFLYLLKECYAYGTYKASMKFRALQQQLYVVFINNSQNGPAILMAQCLYISPILESHSDGLCHLVLSAVRRFLKVANHNEDLPKAKLCAAKLFLDIINGTVAHEEGIMIKVVQVFDIKVSDIDKAMLELPIQRKHKEGTAKEVVERYVFKLIEFQSYLNAVDLLIHFSIPQSGESFLLKMMECQQVKAAEKWATHMGKSMLCMLVQEYVKRKQLKPAYDIIKKNNLHEEFPDIYHQGKESSLKKLAEKGVWEVAETRAKGDRKLLEYLVYLAMEAGYFEKVEELCDRYSFDGFLIHKEPESNLLQARYLNLHELSVEDVFWVDKVDSLHDATCHLEECKFIGVDCEWKPNFEKGSKPNKVSIMQIASEKKVYILDLIKLHEDVPDVLDECLTRILHSPSILKLGYNFQCDVKQLAQSYGDLNCFKHFEMLLDIQNVFKERSGGLSGLAEKILGTGLNKTRRNSNWEQRPLSYYQMEYAALDAAVLLHIFRHVRTHSLPADGQSKIEWKSHIISHMDS